MNLNSTYYILLWDKFKNIHLLSDEKLKNSTILSVKILLEHYQKKESIHLNFQNSKESILQIIKLIIIELANDIYLNHADFPTLIIGKTILRDNRKYSDGKKKNYIINGKINSHFLLFDKKNGVEIRKTYDELLKDFTPIEQGVQQRTITNYKKYFEGLNNNNTHGFTPTNFDMKSVFIAKKVVWDTLDIKNKIPAVYLPNPREEGASIETKSIPALSDIMIYFTPKYEVCYQQLLQKGSKIKTIVIFDTETDKLNQILQDQQKYKFNLLVLSNSNSPIKYDSILFWNWFKEELEIIDAL